MSLRSAALTVARLLPTFRKLENEIGSLRRQVDELSEAVLKEQTLVTQHTALSLVLTRKADEYKAVAEALQQRLEDVELDLYLARSDHHRAAALADSLRAEVAKMRTRAGSPA